MNENNVPAGWRLVPMEPTPEMQRAAETAYRAWSDAEAPYSEFKHSDSYRAMIAAAPVATPTEPAARAQGAGEAMRILGEEIGAYGLLCATKGELAPYRSLVDAMNAVASLITAPTIPQPAATAGKAEGEALREEVATLRVSQWPTGREWSVDADEDMLQRLTAGSYRLSVIAVPVASLSHAPIAAPAGDPAWTEDQIADACVAAEIPDSKFQSLVLALLRSE